MHIIVCYDISNDKRRTRLRKTLLQYGIPVQFSVFECDLSPRQIARMSKAIRAIIVRDKDNVRYYKLCKSCAEEVEFFGGKSLEKTEIVYIV